MRPTGRSPSSTDRSRRLFWLLDALVDGPSSFAASLVFIRDSWPDALRAVSVANQVELGRHCVTEGLIECRIAGEDGILKRVRAEDWATLERSYHAWLVDLAEISTAEVSFDRVGLWFEITPNGRRRWADLRRKFAPDVEDDESWEAEYHADKEMITAVAPTEEIALGAVERLARDLELEIGSCSSEVIDNRASSSNGEKRGGPRWVRVTAMATRTAQS